MTAEVWMGAIQLCLQPSVIFFLAVGVIIGTAIGALPSVSNASISFMTQKLVLDADVPDADALDALLAEAQSVISRIEPDCVILR